jgi:hypothetical protein
LSLRLDEEVTEFDIGNLDLPVQVQPTHLSPDLIEPWQLNITSTLLLWRAAVDATLQALSFYALPYFSNITELELVHRGTSQSTSGLIHQALNLHLVGRIITGN